MENQAFVDPSSAYYTQSKEFLQPLVPYGPHLVLDLGCASGAFGKALLDTGKAAEVVGVELYEPAARQAMKHYKAVHVGDVETIDLSYERQFDIVVCGDVLEHLRNPWLVAERIRGWLKDDGLLVASVPNVRYWRVWKNLIFDGRWEYTAEGIMDQTHLRFFTVREFTSLLNRAFFKVEYQGFRLAEGPKQRFFNKLTLGTLQEFLAVQMLFVARKSSSRRVPPWST
jgi:SAM-dependent methyltransferase